MTIDLKQKIMDSIENLVTLEIITAVSHPDAGEKGAADPFDGSRKMTTRIDLLQGDIKTLYDEEFVTGKYQALRAFHTEKEKEGYQIVMQNIAALEKLLKLAMGESED
ncbi:conserved hypothetical protein [Candidatus Desulfarcum epimagneticum]|uniref:Uncharacterized protein n=1 Tax=uncultured Desulfobacteraceae bacterium TaxID=218296 RepID=A0A484HKE9_9BACT|nr:conserved hypothetical protein [uncultured Desulfobacteraceae bacterium]